MDCRDNLPSIDPFNLGGPWYIARTRSGKDRKACDDLRNRRYQVYRPIMPRRFMMRGRIVDESCSMFPNYLFVRDSTRQGWESLRNTPGVAYFGDGPLLKFGGQLATIMENSSEFRSLRQFELSLWNDKAIANEAPRFRIGDRVQIKKGPWIEFWGEIEALDSTGRVAVLLDILKRRVRAFTSTACLIPAAAEIR